MPLPELLKALEDKTNGGVVRADKPLPRTPERITAYDDLYYEVTF
jgi:hypothetical protein